MDAVKKTAPVRAEAKANRKRQIEYTTTPAAASTVKCVYIPGEIMSRKDLTDTAKVLFGLLRNHKRAFDRHDTPYPKTDELAKTLAVSCRAIQLAVLLLEKKKLLETERISRVVAIYDLDTKLGDCYLAISCGLLADTRALKFRDGKKTPTPITILEKFLLSSIDFKSQRNAWGRARTWQKTLAKELGCSRMAIVRALQRLEDANAIKVDHHRGGYKKGNCYLNLLECAKTKHGKFSNVTNLRRIKEGEPIKEVKKQTAAVPQIVCSSASPEYEKAAQAELDKVQGFDAKLCKKVIYELRPPMENIKHIVADSRDPAVKCPAKWVYSRILATGSGRYLGSTAAAKRIAVKQQAGRSDREHEKAQAMIVGYAKTAATLSAGSGSQKLPNWKQIAFGRRRKIEALAAAS